MQFNYQVFPAEDWKETKSHDARIGDCILRYTSSAGTKLYEMRSGTENYTCYLLEEPGIGIDRQSYIIVRFFFQFEAYIKTNFHGRTLDYYKNKEFGFYYSNDNLILVTVKPRC